MTLSDCLCAECIEVNSSAGDKDAVLHQVAALAKRCQALSGVSADALYQGLLEREKMGSTGLQHGVAIPHCGLKHMDRFVVGILTVPQGVDFDALDGEDSRIFIFLLGPEGDRHGHIRLLSAISRTMMHKGVQDRLLAASSAEEARDAFLENAPVPQPQQEDDTQCLVTVIVQDQEAFAEILPILYSAGSTVSVIEASEGSTYIQQLPLFASLWGDTDDTFHRIIISLMHKQSVNKVVREIREVDNSRATGTTLVVSQEVLSFSGSLLS